MFSDSSIKSGLPGHNRCRPFIPFDRFLTPMPSESLHGTYTADNGGISVSRIIPHVGNLSTIGSVGDSIFFEHNMETSLPENSLGTLPSTTTNFQEDHISWGSGWASTLPIEEMKICLSNDSCSSLSSSLVTSINSEYVPERPRKDACTHVHSKCTLAYDEVSWLQTPPARRSTVRPSYHITGSSEHRWDFNKSAVTYDFRDNYYAPSNELSLSLGSSHHSFTNLPNVPDQCSVVSCSGITQDAGVWQDWSHGFGHSFQNTTLQKGLQSGHKFADSEELSLYCGSPSIHHFSHVLLGSRYLHVIEEILADIASYALQDLDDMDDSLGGIEGEARMSMSSCCSSTKGLVPIGLDEFPLSSGEIKSQGHVPSQLQHQQTHVHKPDLLSMLQMVDSGYNQYLCQIQNVLSTFHFTTEPGTQVNAPFALCSISYLYRSLRERISSQILLNCQQMSDEPTGDTDKNLETSFIQKQWALQQLKKNDQQQSWRPQRGLPEKSVSVLRSWMFQNFLHPYPKDNEKQLLAIKSGLTRSQVANWFINARVRLWKPMIEEMCVEINKASRTKEG